MNQRKKVAIIGAGLSGLSAGIYLARNGFNVEIYEMHDIPGGQCTSWKKGKFIFDGCVHWLVGSKPGAYLSHLWREVGALDGLEIIDHDIYRVDHFPDGQTLTYYTDPEKLEAELLRFAPEDAREIQKFTGAIRKLSRFKMPEPDTSFMKLSLKDLFVLIRSIPGFASAYKWLKISSAEYATNFKNKNLAKSIGNLFAPDFAMLFNLFTFAWLHQKNAGYPVGGSLDFSKRIASKFESLGGTVFYKSKVKKILTENNNQEKSAGLAVGIELENGRKITADYVISASDGRATIDNLLEGKYHHPKLRRAWETLPVFDPLLYISLGIDGQLDDPWSVSGTGLLLNEPVNTGGRMLDYLLLHSMAFDPTLAPEGKSVVEIMCTSDFDFWNNLKNESPEKYKKEKERITAEIIDTVDRDFIPGLKKKIEKIDIASPTSWVDFTGVYRGAFEGLQMTKDVLKVGMSLPKTLHGLDNFYLCGQWVEPGGGLPPAVYSGKNVAVLICKKERKKFFSE